MRHKEPAYTENNSFNSSATEIKRGKCVQSLEKSISGPSRTLSFLPTDVRVDRHIASLLSEALLPIETNDAELNIDYHVNHYPGILSHIRRTSRAGFDDRV